MSFSEGACVLSGSAACFSCQHERWPKPETPVTKHKTIRINAAQYADYDDCLTAAANDVADALEIGGYDMAPRWEDDARENILLDVPSDSDTAGYDVLAGGLSFEEWLAAAGLTPCAVGASQYDLRAAWAAGEDPSEYRVSP